MWEIFDDVGSSYPERKGRPWASRSCLGRNDQRALHGRDSEQSDMSLLVKLYYSRCILAVLSHHRQKRKGGGDLVIVGGDLGKTLIN
jgi:hypothetical protein